MGSTTPGTRNSATFEIGSRPTSSAWNCRRFEVRTQIWVACSTTLAVVRISSSATAMPEPMRVDGGNSVRTPSGAPRTLTTVTTEGRVVARITSTSVSIADKVPCAWDPGTPVTHSSTPSSSAETARDP